MDVAVLQPNPWMMVPFGLLLGLIALAPLFFADWWLKHYWKVALALGSFTLIYYLIGFSGGERGLAHHRALETGEEYIKFIALIGSLYVVSGGIHINVKGQATPLKNVVFLLIGAVIANILGTTGASMLLIRPWLRMNKYRITAHHVVFFIFIVSNVGGCLTPIGDPPLFLGYIKGIPFWWVLEHCFPMWVVGLGMLLALFYVVDRRNFARAPREIREQETAHEQWRFDGLINLFYLGMILFAVFVHRPLFLRELIMLVAAVASYFLTKKSVHQANHFNFHPLQEVGILFIGIFATMMPALDWLGSNARPFLGERPGAGLFYWGTGTLSSVLDNAPTYLSFLSACFGTFINHDVIVQVQAHIASGTVDFSNLVGEHAEAIRHTLEALQKYHGADVAAHDVTVDEIRICFLLGNITFNRYILAISVGAVFFGACTYIGNGPNFMVKSIADHQKAHAPGFLKYVLHYALPFMLPVLVVVWWLFFRR
jgi:Na+/H+ antiporter NhaD/arsenite permease-like protein